MSRAKKREREKRLNKIEETRRVKRSERNIRQKGRKGNPKVKIMSDRRKAFIKKANALFVLVYLVFCIYRISAYFSWKNIVLQMMNNEPSTIVDSSGNIIEKLGVERNKNNVKLSQVPDNLKNAYIDIEDERFYKHKGVDIKRTTAAIGSYVIHAGKSSFGGSTITQQLVKNLTGNDDNSISRKIEEWVKAEELESFCSKDEILETYFNIIYVAPNTYGVDMGAKYYFNKSVSDLDLAECAFLAGINNSPNSYNPFNEKDNSEKIKKRTKAVLAKMHELKHINDSDYNNAVQEVENGLNFQKGDIQSESNGIYSYHADAVVSEVISDISEKKKMSTKFATNYVYMSGLKIYSTEDKEIQQKLEEEYNKSKYVLTSNDGQTSQSAMVIIDHTTGYVVGCVGGLGEKKSARGFNRATQAYRQPGSTIKPIAVIAPGLENKVITAGTVYADVPTNFGTESNPYEPKNDSGKFEGSMTMREAIARSQNIPNVKAMVEIGPLNSINFLREIGVSKLVTASENKKHNDEAVQLALGGITNGISPLEMAAAYAMIANDGEYIEPTFYTKVEDRNGNVVLEPEQERKQVMTEQNAYILQSILTAPVTESYGTATYCAISGMDVAAKTGTTNDSKDRWLCGFTPYYTAAAWYGYDENKEVNFSGRNPAGQIWDSIMTSINKDLESARFEEPSGIVTKRICRDTGLIASSRCSDTYNELFVSGTEPTDTCDGGRTTVTLCSESGKIATEYCPSKYTRTYTTIPEREKNAKWKSDYSGYYGNAPTQQCTIHTKPVEEPKPSTNTIDNTVSTPPSTTGNETSGGETNHPSGGDGTSGGETNPPSGGDSTTGGTEPPATTTE